MQYLHLISLLSVCALLVAALLLLIRAPLGCIVVFCRVSGRPTLIPILLSAKLLLTAAMVG